MRLLRNKQTSVHQKGAADLRYLCWDSSHGSQQSLLHFSFLFSLCRTVFMLSITMKWEVHNIFNIGLRMTFPLLLNSKYNSDSAETKYLSNYKGSSSLFIQEAWHKSKPYTARLFISSSCVTVSGSCDHHIMDHAGAERHLWLQLAYSESTDTTGRSHQIHCAILPPSLLPLTTSIVMATM